MGLARLFVLVGLSVGLQSFIDGGIASSAIASVNQPSPETNISVEDDIGLDKPIDEGTSSSQPTVSKQPTKKKISPKKKESVSDLSKLKMEVADLMKKVHDLEHQQKETHAAVTEKKEPTLAEATQKEMDKKVTSGNDKVKLIVSGQVTRALEFLDNGQNSRLKHVDVDNSPSRFRFVGEGKVNDCVTVGTLIEIQVKMNSTADVDVNNTENSTGTPISTRHVDAYVNHTRFGKLFMGHGSLATDDITEQDLSGTYTATQASGIEGIATAVKFVNKGTKEKTNIAVGDVWIGMDGNRRTRVRYDTPQVMGVVLGASHASTDSWDVSAKFKGEYNGYKMAAGIGFLRDHAASKAGYNRLSGSASILTPIGFNVTLAMGQEDFRARGRKNARYWLARLGYKFNPFKIGDLALAVDFGEQKGRLNNSGFKNGSKAQTWGIAVVQNIDQIATEVFFTVRQYRLSKVSTSASRPVRLNNIFATLLGARLKF